MKIIGKWLLVLAVLMLIVVWYQWPDENLHLVACDVGQGDGLLVVRGFSQVVIDGGPEEGRMSECLSEYMPFWDRSIEVVVSTHPQKDHYGGLLGIVASYKVGVFMSAHLEEMSRIMRDDVGRQNRKMKLIQVYRGDRVMLDEMEWEVLWPEDNSSQERVEDVDWQSLLSAGNIDRFGQDEKVDEDVNQDSVVMQLTWGNFRGLFTADIGEEVEDILKVNGDLMANYGYLKAAHHGSRTSSSQEFLDVVQPEVVVISVGRKNSYGHPSVEVLERFDEMGVVVLRTDELGSVEIISNGESIRRGK